MPANLLSRAPAKPPEDAPSPETARAREPAVHKDTVEVIKGVQKAIVEF
jgi:hypothetical protein